MSIDVNTSVSNIAQYYRDLDHTDPETKKIKRLVIDTKKVGGDVVAFVNYRTLSLGEKFLRFFGSGNASFDSVIQFAAKNHCIDQLDQASKNSLLNKISDYNSRHNGTRSLLRVNVQNVIQGGLLHEKETREQAILRSLETNDLDQAKFIIRNSHIDFGYTSAINDRHFIVSHTLSPSQSDARKIFSLAAEKGIQEILEMLIPITRSISVGWKKNESYTETSALIRALEKGHKDIVELLLTKTRPYLVLEIGGRSILHVAVASNKADVVLETVIRHLDKKIIASFIDNRDNEGNTALHKAIQLKQPALVKMLAPLANPNIKNKSNNTPLHNAAQLGQRESIEYLLTCKDIELNPINERGVTPYDLAKNYPEIQAFLREKGCRPIAELPNRL